MTTGALAHASPRPLPVLCCCAGLGLAAARHGLTTRGLTEVGEVGGEVGAGKPRPVDVCRLCRLRRLLLDIIDKEYKLSARARVTAIRKREKR